jgi:hypothetical protein
VLCWHRLRIRGKLNLCLNCGVLIEECPCVAFRVPDGKCPMCLGSGWLSVVRGNRQKFQDYLDARD